MRIGLVVTAVGALLCCGATASLAQSFPSKPIELVSATGAGGGSDLVCRMVADIIAKEKLLPQPVMVVNKPGGGGAMGQTYVSARRGDPYVFLLAATNLVAAPIRTGLDIGVDKFIPLGAIGFDLNAISVAACLCCPKLFKRSPAKRPRSCSICCRMVACCSFTSLAAAARPSTRPC